MEQELRYDFDWIVVGSGFGGSVVYANTLYRAKPSFFTHPQWQAMEDWESLLAPHYATAEHRLGVKTVHHLNGGGRVLVPSSGTPTL